MMSAALRRVSPLLQTVRICSSNSHRTDDFLKNEALQRRIKRVMDEHETVSSRLERDQLTESDRRTLNLQLAEVTRMMNMIERTRVALRELEEIHTLIHNTAAEEQQMLSLLREEHEDLSRRIEQLNRKLIEALVPADDLDDRSVVLEVAAGRTTGGDVCQQFTREIFDMYHGFASYKNWDWELCNYTPADYGGLHHASVRISGDSVYRWLRFEGGTHRVQRIPEAGLSSRMQRIHTGTMTVIVLPQPRDVDVHIAPKDLRIDTFRSRGAGGQSVNTTDSAVRVVHLPTDTAAEEQQMLSLLREEHEDLSRRIEQLNRKLIEALVPADDLDDRSVVLEVAAGRTTGGDVCQQFTREIFDMYHGFASYKNWDWELCNYTPADYGGLHHASVRISGDSVYRWLRFEGGTHRVQRIPEAGLSSRMQRIHTGTMTVIVLPQPRDVDVHIAPKDLRIDTFRSRGAGGQSVNTTDSAVRVVHLPTGTVAECQQFRSQLKNRDTALRVLRARLYQSIMGQQREQTHTARRQQVGTRCQSERIRTYNFSQDRVTDHRIGHVTRDIKAFLRGGEALEDLLRLLQDRHHLLKLNNIS